MSNKVKSCYKEYPLDLGCSDFEIGKRKIDTRTPVEIFENIPQFEGDSHWCLVMFDDGSMTKVCRPDMIEYFKEN